MDYTEIFSLIMRHTSIQVLLSLMAKHNMELEQMDVKMAFLHENLERICMRQPKSFIETR